MKEYTNGKIIVFWDADKCIHSRNCINGLPEVFNRDKRPWVNMLGAGSEEIMRVIDLCPTEALSYRMADEPMKADESTESEMGTGPSARIEVIKDGPLIVRGSCSLSDADGRELRDCGPFALCRCGGSKNKPYCDGTHDLLSNP